MVHNHVVTVAEGWCPVAEPLCNIPEDSVSNPIALLGSPCPTLRPHIPCSSRPQSSCLIMMCWRAYLNDSQAVVPCCLHASLLGHNHLELFCGNLPLVLDIIPGLQQARHSQQLVPLRINCNGVLQQRLNTCGNAIQIPSEAGKQPGCLTTAERITNFVMLGGVIHL